MVMRRRALVSGSARIAVLLAGAGVLPLPSAARSASYASSAFEARSLAEALRALNAGAPVESTQVTVTAPDIAENGAAVPIAIAASLPGVRRLLLLVEKNPAVLSAVFDVGEAIEPSFSTRVKMGQSSLVYAVAMLNDGKVLYAQKDVRVMLGGCGG